MNPEIIVLSNLLVYIFGFLVLFTAKGDIFSSFSDWFVLGIFILGVIFASSLQESVFENFQISYNWIQINKTQINFDILLDHQAYFMYVLIQVIALLVVLFSSKYLRKDISKTRFYAYICLFVPAMLGLVIAGNLLQFYIFWELVGFCSFLLIGFWYEKKTANSAAFKSFIINRLGDCFLMAGIFMVFYIFKTLNFISIQILFTEGNIFNLENHYLNLSIATLLMFVGVMSKSAQFPLEIWLPRAMEGPTPASALIHAATMVVAGVFLLARINPILLIEVRYVIACVGCITAVIGAFSALFQNKIKAALAYSTISQLGMMVAGMGIGAVGAANFHLATHASFKAGLFLGAGAVIDIFNHNQDMRKMGGLQKSHPVLFYSFCICAASLCGIPLTSGFLSKDALISSAFTFVGTNYFSFKMLIPLLLILTSFITALYMIRIVVMTFLERQESQIDKIIQNTKKTMGGALKTFENILTGEKQNVSNDVFVDALKTSGIYEICVFCLALGSLFFVFSVDILSFDQVWYIKRFAGLNSHVFWIPWLLMGLFVLALLISYNTTSEEIRNFYLQKRIRGIKKPIIQWTKDHFYIEDFYKRIFSKVILKYGVESTNSRALGIVPIEFAKIEKSVFDRIVAKSTDGFIYISKTFGKIDEFIVDNAVNKLSNGVMNLGEKVKNLQKSNLQIYILTMILVVLVFGLIKFLI
jgi:NADH-quinone oxidoreductase subunit L